MTVRLLAPRNRIFVLAAVAFIAAAWGVGALVTEANRPPDFYFMPGPLGRVARPSARDGRTVEPSSRLTASDLQFDISAARPAEVSSTAQPFPRSTVRPVDRSTGYQTRALSGLNTREEQEWATRNHLTPPLAFSHHLAEVFPRALFKTHPEYFPLIWGQRLDPADRIAFWQPDLGREDVAHFAAEQAKQYFDQHPTAETFSLGVNDGLMFGESPETVALLRAAAAAASRTVEPKHRPTASDHSSTVRPFDSTSVRPFDRPTVRSLDRSTDRPYFRNRPDFSPLVFTFMNRAAADLARSHPDKYLGCLAYYWCENAPPFPVDPHIIPFLTADRAQSYDPAFQREEFALQARWARALSVRSPRAGKAVPSAARDSRPKLRFRKTEMDSVADQPMGSNHSDFSVSAFQFFSFSNNPRTSDPQNLSSTEPQIDRSTVRPLHRPRDQNARSTVRPLDRSNVLPRLGLYDYLYGFGFLIPRVPIHAFAEHIRHAHEVGFTDYFAELNPNWALDGPKPWVIAQLLQDPEQDVDRLLDTYYSAYFQNAAGPMRQFFDRCETQWMQQKGPVYWLKQYRNESQAELFPSAVCVELRRLLNLAASKANSDLVRRRVAFVADAFGVTERFVLFCEARTALASAVLRREAATTLSPLLVDYRSKRSAFIRYTHQLTDREPLAFSRIEYTDWLKDDPAFAATLAIAESAALGFSGSEVQGFRAPGAQINRPPVQPFNRSTVRPLNGARELLPHGEFAGPLQPGAQIGGLRYGIDLPAPWTSTVEPIEHFRASVVRSGASAPLLRITGSLATTISQRAPISPGRLYIASATVRAQVSPTGMVMLTLGWLDAKQRRIGTSVGIRLPEGHWPDWVELRQGARAPAGAVSAELTLAVKRQFGSDFAEVGKFSLRISE